MALQADHPLYRDAASCASLLVAERFDDDHPSLVSFSTLSFPRFLGRILGTSKKDLTVIGHLVSLFADVSGDPYGTGIDLRRIEVT